MSNRSPTSPSRLRVHPIRTALVALLFGCGALAVSAGESSAQSCSHSCPVAERDAHGCCPAVKLPGGTGPVSACPAGQEKTIDTAGHCCWPGQVWSSNKCIGVPTACPAGYVVDAAEQRCKQAECQGGKVRPANDKNQCCWPGQVWSKARAACVGTPKSCPAGYVPSGEECALADTDHDGIPDLRDKCPNEAEDRNGFEDDDGCPDEARRQDIERQKKIDADKAAAMRADKEAALRLEEDRKRKEAAAAEAKAKAEEDARRAEQARLNAEREAAREKGKALLRGGGVLMLIGGVAGSVAMTVSLSIGDRANDNILRGGYATGKDIEAAIDRGNTANTAARVAGGVGGAVFALGLTLTIAGSATERKAVAVVPTPGGLMLRGSF